MIRYGMPSAPKKAFTIGTPIKEVLPRGTISRRTPVFDRDQPKARAASRITAAENRSIAQGTRAATSISRAKVSCGTLSRISAGSDT